MTNDEALNIWLPIISMGIENMPELKEAFNMAVESLKGKWTPVSDPPKKDGRYLAYIVNKDDPKIKYSMTCQFIQNSIGDNPWFPDDECASNNVVAWMPLPEEYKDGENNESCN